MCLIGSRLKRCTRQMRGLLLSYPTTLLMNVPYALIMGSTNEVLREAINPGGEHSLASYMLAGAGAGYLAGSFTSEEPVSYGTGVEAPEIQISRLRNELDELREAQHRLEREYTERDAAAKAAERRAAESEHRAKQAAARAAKAEELLAASRSSKPADASKYMRKIAKLEKKLRTAERLLETVLQMNKLLVEGQAPPPPPSPRVRTQPPPPPARARPRRRARRTQPPPPRVRSRSPLSKPKRRSRSPRPRDEARPLPWVPSSDGGVSFNLAAACQYALRRTQHAA